MKWKTKNGKVLDVKDMESDHIRNSIAMLERHLENQPASGAYAGMSDVAGDWVEQENRENEAIASETREIIGKLKLELIERQENGGVI